MLATLNAAFNRQGFTDGYYAGQTGQQMFGVREDKYDDPNWLKEARQTYESGENPLVPLQFKALVTSQRASLAVSDPQGRICMVDGPVPEPARTQELTADMLTERLGKTGGTPYFCAGVEAHVEPGLMLSAAAINAMRRDVLNQLTALRGRTEVPRLSRPTRIAQHSGAHQAPELTVQVTTREQITGRLLKTNPKVLYVPLHILAEDLPWCSQLAATVNVCAVLPRIAHDGDISNLKRAMQSVRQCGVTQVLVGNLGLMIPARECGMDIRGDFGLNLYSSGAMELLRQLELRSVCLSFEMTLPQIRDVSKPIPAEMLVYGRMPLMVTENCLIRGRTGECTCHLSPTRLIDKTGAEFPIIKDGNSCRSVLLNGKKLSLLDRREDLTRLGLWAARLYFTTENMREVDQVLAACQNPPPFDPGACTRGLYLRGLD